MPKNGSGGRASHADEIGTGFPRLLVLFHRHDLPELQLRSAAPLRICYRANMTNRTKDPAAVKLGAKGGKATAARLWVNPELRRRRSEALKRAWADPEIRRRIRAATRQALANPEVRQRMSEAVKRRKNSAAMKLGAKGGKATAARLTPAERSASARRAALAHWANPEVRQRRSEAMKRAWADPKVRRRWSEAAKRAWADPEVRQRRTEAIRRALVDPEVRQRRIEAIKRALVDPKARGASALRRAIQAREAKP